MSRNLKDIVDEGFARLNVLAEKRTEIVKRCSVFTEEGAHFHDDAVNKLKDVEKSFTSEVTERTKQSEAYLQQMLAQIAEDNERFLSSLQKNLQLRVSKITQSIAYEQEQGGLRSAERLDSLVKPFERELAAGSSDLKLQSSRLLAGLERACKQSHAKLLESQTMMTTKLSNCSSELSLELRQNYTDTLSKLSDTRAEKNAAIEKMYSKLTKSLEKFDKDLDKQIEQSIKDALKEFDDLQSSVEKSLLESQETALKSATEELDSKNEESLTELKDSSEFGNQEIDDKMAELKQSTDELTKDLKNYLSGAEDDARARASKRADRIKMSILFGDDPDAEELVSRNPLAGLPEEMHELTRSFKERLNKLLKSHSEKLSEIRAENEKSWNELGESFDKRFQEKLAEDDNAWQEKEAKLNSQIEALEQRALELCAELAAAAEADSQGDS